MTAIRQFHPEAIEDIRQAVAWYRKESDSVADRFKAELRHAELRITSTPQTWPDYLLGTKRYVIKKYPYSLVDVQRSDKIIILAVAHSRRKPGYWDGRKE